MMGSQRSIDLLLSDLQTIVPSLGLVLDTAGGGPRRPSSTPCSLGRMVAL